MNNSKLLMLSIVALLIITLSVGLVGAQYSTEKTTQITLDSSGFFTAYEADLGITYVVNGISGASGSVTAAVYSGNPQATASIPSGVGLSKFTVITFDMDADDFTAATITFSYTDDDLENLQAPFAVYKYLPDSDSFVELSTVVDVNAKTMSVTLTSVDDPLFAIGGAMVVDDALGTSTWIIVAVAAIIVVVVAVWVVFLVMGRRNSGKLE